MCLDSNQRLTLIVRVLYLLSYTCLWSVGGKGVEPLSAACKTAARPLGQPPIGLGGRNCPDDLPLPKRACI